MTRRVHHTISALDRPRLGTNKIFRHITHEKVFKYLSFELEKSNKLEL